MILNRRAWIATLLPSLIISLALNVEAAEKVQQKQMMRIGDKLVSMEMGQSFLQAQRLIDGKQFDEASNVLHSLVEQAPDMAAFHYKLAFVLKQQGKLAEAQSEAQKCIDIDSNFVGGWSVLGESLLDQKEPAKALIAFKKALELQPSGENTEIIKEYIEEIENPPADDSAEVEAQNAEIAKTNNQSMRINRALSLCDEATKLFSAGSYPAGMTKYRDALRLAPQDDTIKENFIVGLNNYSAFCVQHQQLKKAEELLREAIDFQKSNKTNPSRLYTTMKNYQALLSFTGRVDEAKLVKSEMERLPH